MNKGYDEYIGIYTTRYYANKVKSGDEVVVKVGGGYVLMTAEKYNKWRKQR